MLLTSSWIRSPRRIDVEEGDSVLMPRIVCRMFFDIRQAVVRTKICLSPSSF